MAEEQGSEGNRRVFVGNLAYSVRWQDLKDHMSEAGPVKHADVLMDDMRRSKGCGLIEYESPDDAKKAVEELSDTELHGRRIFVREDREPNKGSIHSIARGNGGRGGRAPAPGRGRGEGRGRGAGGRGGYGSPTRRPPRTTTVDPSQLYVGNLPWATSSDDLETMFSAYGNVERAEIAVGPQGTSKGFGIVKFSSPDEAQSAISALNGTELSTRIIEVREDRS